MIQVDDDSPPEKNEFQPTQTRRRVMSAQPVRRAKKKGSGASSDQLAGLRTLIEEFAETAGVPVSTDPDAQDKFEFDCTIGLPGTPVEICFITSCNAQCETIGQLIAQAVQQEQLNNDDDVLTNLRFFITDSETYAYVHEKIMEARAKLASIDVPPEVSQPQPEPEKEENTMSNKTNISPDTNNAAAAAVDNVAAPVDNNAAVTSDGTTAANASSAADNNTATITGSTNQTSASAQAETTPSAASVTTKVGGFASRHKKKMIVGGTILAAMGLGFLAYKNKDTVLGIFAKGGDAAAEV